MSFLLFIRKYWGEISLVIIVILIFIAGYYLRILQESSAEIKKIKTDIKTNNEAAAEYEKTFAAISARTDYLNHQLKITYEEPGNRCTIPADGLRLIQQANR